MSDLCCLHIHKFRQGAFSSKRMLILPYVSVKTYVVVLITSTSSEPGLLCSSIYILQYSVSGKRRPWPDCVSGLCCFHIHKFRQGAFSSKNMVILFLFLHENICCGHSLEAPHVNRIFCVRLYILKYSVSGKRRFWSEYVSGLCCFHIHKFRQGAFSSKRMLILPYFSVKTYVVVLITSTSSERGLLCSSIYITVFCERKTKALAGLCVWPLLFSYT